MYYVKKRFEISAAHRLRLSYPSKCSRLHGHNWIVTVECRAQELNQDGMVVDFTHIKELVMDRLDHSVINDVIDCNPTAENMARWIVDNVPYCWRCERQVSEGNIAIYEKE